MPSRSDNFDRADENPINVPSDGGSAWQLLYRTGTDTFRVTSNQCKYSGGGNPVAYALDCGNAGCVLCHCDKILGVPTRQERKAALAFKEQLP